MADEYLDINLGELRVHEIETIEEIIDGPIDRAFAEGAPRGKALRAIGFVVKRRENPEFTLEDAGNLILRVKTEDTDPTDAAG